jgi:PRTRC genetic system protein B
MDFNVNSLVDDYHLSAAMLFYKNKRENGYYNSTKECYVETRSIHKVKGKLVYGPGKPVTLAAIRRIKQLLDSTEQGSSQSGLLPKNLLALKPNGDMIWYAKPQKRKLFLENHDRPLNVHCPGFVFMLRDSQLSIFTVKAKSRPTNKTRLYHTPLWNVTSQEEGTICTGNVTMPKRKAINDQIAACEKAFFGSYFSHIESLEVDEKLKLWLTLDKTGEVFPCKILSPNRLHKNIERLLENKGF